MFRRKGQMFQRGGAAAPAAPSYTNTILTGNTSLINSILTLQSQLNIGQIGIIGKSSLSVVGYMSSAGYEEIQAVQQHLSSIMVTGNMDDNPLFSQILALNGYISISDYADDYASSVQDIADAASTATGLKAINDLSGGRILQTVDWQVHVANIAYSGECATYQIELSTQSTLSSQYISTAALYSTAVANYIEASTLEYTSKSTLLPQYTHIMNAYWQSLQDIIGAGWMNINSVTQSGGASTSTNNQSLESVLAAYSSLQLSDTIIYDVSKVGYYSTLLSTTSSYLQYYQAQLNSSITCDYSTLINTYIPNIMQYKNEIMHSTSGEFYNEMSTLIGYSTLWISALQADATASTVYATNISTYTYYDGLMNRLSANIASLSTIYKSTLTSFKSWERMSSTNRTIVQFLEFQLAEMNALSLFNNAMTLKSELQDMINLINSGANVDDYFLSVQGAFTTLQSGGGTSLQDIQLMYSTVTIMNDKYNTMYANTTAARQAAALPPSINEIYAITLSTTLGIWDSAIASAQDMYDLNTLSTVFLSREISSQTAYLSAYSSISTITGDEISSMYMAEWSAYQSSVQLLITQAYSTQQAIYQYVQAGLVSSVTVQNLYNVLQQIMLRLVELGYQVSNTGEQMGGGNVTDFIQNNRVKLIESIGAGLQYIQNVCSIQLNLEDGVSMGLIGAAAAAASTAKTNLVQIQESIDLLQNATNDIESSTFVTVGAAIRELNADAAQYSQYSHAMFAYNYSTSYFKYENYLTSLFSLSTCITTNLLENRDDITQLQWYSSFPGQALPGENTLENTYSTNIDYNNRIAALSTKSQSIREYRPILQSFVNVVLAEEFSRFYYLVVKSTFERQEYYRIQQGGRFSDMMSAYDFDQLTTAYDVSIQNVNRYIAYRTNMFQPFLNATNSLAANSIRQDVLETLQTGAHPVLPAPAYTVTSSLKMEFTTISPRMVFPKSGIPTTTLLDCPSTVGTDPSMVQTTTYPAEPTTTLPTVVYGIQGRYINISRADGVFEILQVCVIDSMGRNVAFGKIVTGPEGAPSAADIVNGQYTDSPASFRWTAGPSTLVPTFQIDLGAVYDITCIRYSKPVTSRYITSGLKFDILNSSMQRVGGASPVAGTAIEDMDLRTAGPASKAPMYANYSRTGAGGYFGRYVRITQPAGGFFQLSQIAVVSMNGANIALGAAAATYSSATATPVSTTLLTDGTYHSRPVAACLRQAILNPTAYVQVDLGSEQEVVAVHLYGANDVASPNLNGSVATLYTQDNQVAYFATATTDSMKNVLDFRYQNQSVMDAYLLKNQVPATTVSMELLWPPYYGEAGIICRYIAVTKDSAQLGFTKIKVVDKSGRDIALFKPISASSEAVENNRYYGVSDYADSQPMSQSFVSAPGDNSPKYLVDLERTYEVCSITLYRCSDAPELADNVKINLYGGISDSPPLTQFSTITGQAITYDTRYDPDDNGSIYPIDSLSTIYSYGRFGTLAITVDIPVYTSTMNITEGTGQDLYPASVIIPNVSSYTVNTAANTISYTSSLTTVKFENLREVNSVIIPTAPIGTRIVLRDCDGYIVNNKPIQYFSTGTTVYRLADFRNPYGTSQASYAPMAPLKFGTFETADTNVQELYDDIRTPEGVATRYVKISPPTATTSLYLSQILVVDSRGINIAFQADTFTTDSQNVTKTGRVVDGDYEQSLDSATVPSIVSYENYVRREPNQCFISNPGYYWVVDLGKEYLVNSIVFVTAAGHGTDSQNVVVELFNAQLNRVAVQLISSYVAIFGVDILDFRVDRSVSAYADGAYLEVRPREVRAGCTGCGIMAQFIRLEGASIRLSQIIALDPYGNNIALYMPTYSPANTASSYKLVDGKYYQKMEVPLQGTTDAYISSSDQYDYVEVNFGTELELVSVFLITTMEHPDFIGSGVNIKIFNKYRDVIATLSPSVAGAGFTAVNVSLTNKAGLVFPSATNVIGVTILKKYSNFLIAAGQMAGRVTTGTPTPMPGVSCTPGSFLPIICAERPSLTMQPLFRRGANGGIPARYIRVYNVSQYVQISQIMAYGIDGTNYAYQKPTTSASIFPGTYPAKATDGLGGYFHTARNWGDSYRSAGDRYGFLEVDMGTTREIIGLRCVFASDDQGQNMGTRIYILDDTYKVLSQYVVGPNVSAYDADKYEFQELIVDYRIKPVSIPITFIIMPKIASVPNLGAVKGPNGVVELGGNLYVADTIANRIWKNGSAFVTGGLISRPVGLVADETNLYMACSGTGNIVKIPVDSGTPATLLTVPNAYGLCMGEIVSITTGGGGDSGGDDGIVKVVGGARPPRVLRTLITPILCITSYIANSNKIFTYDWYTNTSSDITMSRSINYPNSIAYVTIPGSTSYLLVCSSNDKCIYKTEFASGATTVYIGATAPIQLALIAPSAICYDPKTSILFISDFTQNVVYSVNLLTDEVARIAGTGKGGYKGDGAQGSLALLDGPMNLSYSGNTGFLYISDYTNKAVRYLNLYSQPAETIASTTTAPTWSNWTTTTLGELYTDNLSTLSISAYEEVEAIPTTFSQIVNPARISNVGAAIPQITAFYIVASSMYYATSAGLFVYQNPTPIATGFGHISCILMSQGALYLCDVTNNCIWKQGIVPSTFTKYIGVGADSSIRYTGLIQPVWAGFDNRGRFYVSVSTAILRMNKLGNGLEVYVGGAGNQVSGTGLQYGSNIALNSPGAFVFDSQNNLIFVEYTQESVYKVLDADGTIQPICNYPTAPRNYIGALQKESILPVKNGAINYNIGTPLGITIDSDDTLYVTSGSKQIIKLRPSTYNVNSTLYDIDVLAGFGSFVAGTSNLQDTIARYAALNGPSYIYYTSDGIYFLDLGVEQIRKITLEVDTTIMNRSILPYAPVSIVANYSRNTYNSTMTSGEEISALMAKFYAGGVCCDTVGNVYFPDSLNGNILKMDESSNLSVLATGFTAPSGIANYKDGIIYVLDAGQIWPLAISGGGRGTAINLAGCQSIAISSVGYLYAISGTNISIFNLKSNNSLVGTIQVSKADGYTVSSVNSICVDTDGNVYVGVRNGIATFTYKIFKYSSSTIATIIQASSNTYLKPVGATENLTFVVTGLIISGGELYYINGPAVYQMSPEPSSPACMVLSTEVASGTLALGLPIIGTPGIKGQASDGTLGNTTTLLSPLGLCVDMNGVMYITDVIARSATQTLILKIGTYTQLQPSLLYNITGANAIGPTVNNMSAYLQTFNQIQGVCYDSVGNMYISDSGQNTVSKIDLMGTLKTFAGFISTSGAYRGDMESAAAAALWGPTDIKMSKSDVLFISDTKNNAIRRVKEYADMYEIETYVSDIPSPTAIAIDSQDNVYVVTRTSTIGIISPVTETISTVINTGYPVYGLAVDTNDRLYYTGGGRVSTLDGAIKTGLINPTGLTIDASNTIYVSDEAANKVYSYVGTGPLTVLIGNGDAEPPLFSLTAGVAQNIYGSGAPPLTRAFSAPGALAVNAKRGLLVAQATKVSLLSLGAAPANFVCGQRMESFIIRNNGSVAIQLSQAVALDYTGTNVILGLNDVAHTDGFYGCRATVGTSIAAGQSLTVTLASSTTITCILLYMGSVGKLNWNEATLQAGTSIRYVEGVPDSPLAQYILFDYRTKTPACTPFINYVNKYALQTTNTPPPITATYRIKYARYVRVAPAGAGPIVLTQIAIIHGETGQNLCAGMMPNISPTYTANIPTFTAFTNPANPNSNPKTWPAIITAQADIWLEYDLGDEYPIEQVILGVTNASMQYTISAYTSNRTQLPWLSTYNPLDNQIKYVRVEGTETASAISGIGSATTVGTPSAYTEYTPTLTPPSNTVTYTVTAPVPATPSMLILYNEARQELFRTGLTYSPYTFTLANPTRYSYSFMPIVGVQRVRYVVFQGGSVAANIKQLIVFDSNRINVSYGKTVQTTSVGSAFPISPINGTDTTPFAFTIGDVTRKWTLDLGQEYELIQIVYMGSTAPPSGTTITLFDAFQVQQGASWSLTTATQSLDLRGPTHFVALPWPSPNASENLYVPDTGLRGFIRGRYVRIENSMPIDLNPPQFSLTVMGGTYGTSGTAQDKFNTPLGAAMDGSGNIYVADTNNHRISMVAPNGTVTVIAGTGTAGSTDGSGNVASFFAPNAVACGPGVGAARLLYVADTSNATIRKMVLTGTTWVVSTFAGTAGMNSVFTDGLKEPSNSRGTLVGNNIGNDPLVVNGIVTIGGVKVYYAKDGVNTKMVDENGVAKYLVSNAIVPDDAYVSANYASAIAWGTGGYVYVPPPALFRYPWNIRVDANGNVYVTEMYLQGAFRMITPAGYVSTVWLRANSVSTLAGSGTMGPVDNTGIAARFHGASQIDIDSAGNVYIADRTNHCIRMMTPGGVVTTIAGTPESGNINGVGNTARFNNPVGIIVDNAGTTVYVCEVNNHCIRKIVKSGATWTVSTFAGSTASVSGYLNGTGAAARFNEPYFLAFDNSGNILVTEPTSRFIRKITPAGVVTTIAGNGTDGSSDGAAVSAQFRAANGIAVGKDGIVYIADAYGQRVRTVNPGIKNIYTIAGTGTAGTAGSASDFTYTWTDNCTGYAGYGFMYTSTSTPPATRTLWGSCTTPTLVSGPVLSTAAQAAKDALTAQNGQPATSAKFNTPRAISIDSAGNIYVAEQGYHCIRKFTPGGTLTTIAGNALAGFSGSGIIAGATSANFNFAASVTIDANGNLLVAEYNNHCIRKIIQSTGTVITIAGTGGTAGFTNGAPTNGALFRNPLAVAVDPSGNIYVADHGNNVIRKIPAGGGNTSTVTTTGFTLSGPQSVIVGPTGLLYVSDTVQNRILSVNPSTGATSVIAGLSSGTAGYNTDINAAVATNAQINLPRSATVDSAGNIYVADTANYRIRKVSPNGIISTIAGTGVQSTSAGALNGDGGQAINATFATPTCVIVDPAGNLYVADAGNHRIRMITPAGVISTVAGNGSAGGAGVGNAATAAELYNPKSMVMDSSGNIYVAEHSGHRVSKFKVGGILTIFAGTGSSGYTTGDNNQATSAKLHGPQGIGIDSSRNIYIGDTSNHCIRKVTPGGIITTIAGTGTAGFAGDGGAATSALLDQPVGVSVDSSGNIYVAEWGNHRVRMITSAGIISTFAGTGTAGNTGDGGLATAAKLSGPMDVRLDTAGNLYVTNYWSATICKVTRAGIISTVAGTGISGYAVGGDGIATSTPLDTPANLALDSAGNLYVADYANHCVRKIVIGGIMSTVAGTGAPGYTGEGGLATAGTLNYPLGVAIDSSDNLYITDAGNHRIRVVACPVATIAGTGAQSSSPTAANGDGGLATAATFNWPACITLDAENNIYIADKGNNRIRKFTVGGNISTIAGTGVAGWIDTSATDARLNEPYGLVFDASGNLIFSEKGRIRKITFQPNPVDIIDPTGICVDSSNNIYIAGNWSYKIVKVAPTTWVPTVIAGSGSVGYAAGQGAAAQIGRTYPIVVDASNNVFVGDITNNVIWRINPSGAVSIFFSSTTRISGNSLSIYAGGADLGGYGEFLMDGSGNLWTLDSGNHCIQRIVQNYTPPTFSVTTPAIYDMFGKNLVNGKLITSPPASTQYGSSWEIDLGQEYAIRNIVYTGSTNPIVVYNRLRAEMWRNYTNIPMSVSLLPQVAPATGTGNSVRFVRLTGTCTVNHIVVNDSRGIDVVVWKPVRTVSGSAVTYSTFNGLYNSGIAVTGAAGDRLEIDLGVEYKVANVTVYLSYMAAPVMSFYTAAATVVAGISVTVTTALPTSIQKYTGYGIKTRYVGLTLPAAGTIYNLAVIDSLGRNVAGTVRVSSGSVPSFPNNYQITPYSIPTYTEVDLGSEYSITSVVLTSRYTGTPTLTSLPTPNTSLSSSATLKLMDAYYKPVLSRALTGTGGTYNISWPIGTGTAKYAGPPTGATVIPGTANSIWSFPITEQVAAGPVGNLPGTITGMAVALDETIYFTCGDANIYRILPGSTTHTIFRTCSAGSTLKGIAYYQKMLGTFKIYFCNSAKNTIGYFVEAILGSSLVENWCGGGSTADGSAVLNGTGTATSFNNPTGIVINNEGNTLYVTDTGNHLIRTIVISSGDVATLAGTNPLVTWKEGTEYPSDAWQANWAPSREGYNCVWVGGSVLHYECYPDTSRKKFRITSGTINAPTQITIDTSNLYVVQGGTVIKIDSANAVTTIYNGGLTFTSLSYNTNLSKLYGTNNTGVLYEIATSGASSATAVTKAGTSQAGYITAKSLDTTNSTIATDSSAAASTASVANWAWPGVAQNDSLRIPTITNSSEAKFGTLSFIASELSGLNTINTTSVMFVVESSKIRRIWSSTWPRRLAHCQATLAGTAPANSFLLSRSFRFISPTDSAVTIAIDSPNYPLTPIANLNPLIYQSPDSVITTNTLVESIENKYYSIIDRPLIGPYTASSAPVVNATATQFLGATFTEVVDFSPPGLPAFTFGNQTYTTFQITALSADYATGFRYSLNGRAQTTITMPLALPITITPLESYFSIVVYATNGNGSTSALQYVQLTPPAPVLSLVSDSVTTNGFTVTWPAPSILDPNYTASYRYTVTGQAAVTTNNTSATISVPTAGSYPTVTVIAIYTYGASELTSLASAPLSVQLLPAAPTLGTPSAIGATSFTIDWTAAPPAPAAGGYATIYSYSVDGGTAQTTNGTSVTISTGLTAHSNTSFSLSVVYTKTGSPSRTSAATTTNIPLAPSAPPAPTLNAATSVTTTGFNISWSAVPNANNAAYMTSYSYTVTDQAAVTTNDTYATISVPTAGSYPTITVTAVYTYGATVVTSLASAPLSVQLIPAAPTLGTPYGIDDTSFTIDWTPQPAPVAGGYTTRYSYKVHHGATQKKSGTISGTSVTISSGLVANANHIFSLSVVYSKTGEPTRTSATITTNIPLAPLAPPAPTLNAATSVTTTGFDITWSAAPNAYNAAYKKSYSYRVQELWGPTRTVRTDDTNATVSDMNAGNYVVIRVTAMYTYSDTVVTSLVSEVGVQLKPPAPTLKTPSAIGNTSFTIGWEAEPAPAGGGYTTEYNYKVYDGATLKKSGTISGTSVTISSGLTAHANHSFRLYVMYTKSGEPTRTSATTRTDIQLT